MDDLVPIGEFSDRSGLSPKRLRSYAAVGLLVPAAVDPDSGYRYYSPGQLRDARLIDALRTAGVPLADIGVLLRDPSGEQLDAWSARVQTDAAERHEALNTARRLLAIDDRSSAPHHEHEGKLPMPTLQAASRTEPGPVRDKNEDAVLTADRLAVVADGIGGSPGGAVASAAAIALVGAAYTGRSLDELEAGVRAANRAVWDRAGSDAQLEGMGTTICAVGVTEDGDLGVVNVGDSRAYLVHNGSIHQLTNDHTITAELVRRGVLSEDAALEHPHRNVLTRALGVGPEVELDTTTHKAVAGDRLLLCSDGLYNEVPDDEIASAMSASDDVGVVADRLVGLALSHECRDNVSVVVAEICA